MRILILLTLIFTIQNLRAQSTNDTIGSHGKLVGGIWKGEGSWTDGSPFKLDIQYDWGLSGHIIKTKTFGNVKAEGYQFGLRNEGIRVWNGQKDLMEFWEFDIFGGITNGFVSYLDQNIYYHYTQDFGQGPIELTDGWEYLNADIYNYSVGIFDREKGQWDQKFLSTQMKRFQREE